jgi:Haem-degrading
MLRTSAALLLLSLGASVNAQGLITTQKLSAALANELVGESVAACAAAASLTLARKEDSTKAVAERLSKNPPSTVPQTPLPNVTYAVGGVTIKVGETPIGAIGISGAPGGQFDEECARAALAKIKDRMT